MNSVSTWAKKIEARDLPILKYTSNSIISNVDKEETTASQLAKIILSDTSLTAGLLRIANSVIFNPNKMPVNTIHRAVMFLGFDMIRGICLTLSLIDTLLKTKSQSHVKNLMAKSFHTAVMARALAERRGDDTPEEVFIAALLSSVGEIAFCCVAEDQTEEILTLQQDKQCSLNSAQREILGFTFAELTIELTNELSIGGLVKNSVITSDRTSDPRTREIDLSKRISQECTANPKDEITMNLVEELGSYLDLDNNKTWNLILEQSESVRDTVGEYGANEILNYLPELSQSDQAVEEEKTLQESLPDYPEEDAAIQLTILKDLGEALETRANLGDILQIILEGINRGVGMDRVLFALLSSDRKFVKEKFTVGIDTRNLQDHFYFLVEAGNIFHTIFESGKSVWINKDKDDHLYALLNHGATKVFETTSFFLCPIIINKKPIGVLYADKQPSKREITQDNFSNFKHFGQQTCMAIRHISEKR